MAPKVIRTLSPCSGLGVLLPKNYRFTKGNIGKNMTKEIKLITEMLDDHRKIIDGIRDILDIQNRRMDNINKRIDATNERIDNLLHMLDTGALVQGLYIPEGKVENK